MGFARLFRPTYAGANMGHPEVNPLSETRESEIIRDNSTGCLFFALFFRGRSVGRPGAQALGFPRPVETVVNRSVVFSRFHQRRHSFPLGRGARTPPVFDNPGRSAAASGCIPLPGTLGCGVELPPGFVSWF